MAIPTTTQRAKSAPAVTEEHSAAGQDFKDHIREAAAGYRDRLIAAAPPTMKAQSLSDKQEQLRGSAAMRGFVLLASLCIILGIIGLREQKMARASMVAAPIAASALEGKWEPVQ